MTTKINTTNTDVFNKLENLDLEFDIYYNPEEQTLTFDNPTVGKHTIALPQDNGAPYGLLRVSSVFPSFAAALEALPQTVVTTLSAHREDQDILTETPQIGLTIDTEEPSFYHYLWADEAQLAESIDNMVGAMQEALSNLTIGDNVYHPLQQTLLDSSNFRGPVRVSRKYFDRIKFTPTEGEPIILRAIEGAEITRTLTTRVEGSGNLPSLEVLNTVPKRVTVEAMWKYNRQHISITSTWTHDNTEVKETFMLKPGPNDPTYPNIQISRS